MPYIEMTKCSFRLLAMLSLNMELRCLRLRAFGVCCSSLLHVYFLAARPFKFVIRHKPVVKAAVSDLG